MTTSILLPPFSPTIPFLVPFPSYQPSHPQNKISVTDSQPTSPVASKKRKRPMKVSQQSYFAGFMNEVTRSATYVAQGHAQQDSETASDHSMQSFRRASFGVMEGLASFINGEIGATAPTATGSGTDAAPLMVCAGMTIHPARSHLRTKRSMVKIEYPTPRTRPSSTQKTRNSGTRRRSQSTSSAASLRETPSSSSSEESLSSTMESLKSTKSSSSSTSSKNKKKSKKRAQSATKVRRNAATTSPIKRLSPLRRGERKDLKTFLNTPQQDAKQTTKKRVLNTIKPKEPVQKALEAKTSTPASTIAAARSTSPPQTTKRRPLQSLHTNSVATAESNKKETLPADKNRRQCTTTATAKKEPSTPAQPPVNTKTPHTTTTQKKKSDLPAVQTKPAPAAKESAVTRATPKIITDAEHLEVQKQKKRDSHEQEKQRKEILRKQIYAQNRLAKFVAVHQWKSMLMLEEDFERHFSGCGDVSHAVGEMNHAV